MRRRGHRWDPGGDGATKARHVDVAEVALDAERDFLRREIYGRPDARIEVRRMEAVDRYSERCRTGGAGRTIGRILESNDAVGAAAPPAPARGDHDASKTPPH